MHSVSTIKANYHCNTNLLQGDEVDAEEDCENETDNDDFWEELDSAKRAAAKKASLNPGECLSLSFCIFCARYYS